eukprot:COSAG06_NODE_7592_length_2448_cov_27.669221_2_plen_173_part_00
MEASISRENEDRGRIAAWIALSGAGASAGPFNLSQPDVTRPQGNAAALPASDDDPALWAEEPAAIDLYSPAWQLLRSGGVSLYGCSESGSPVPAPCIWTARSWHGTAGGSGSTTMHRGPRQQNRPGGSERYTRGSRSSAEASGVRNNAEDQGSMSCSCSSVWSRSQRAWGCR